jgi:hypothetical protein
MSKWNDRKKKDDEQNAQIEKPEESTAKDYSAGAIGKAYANTERPAMKTAQAPSFDEPSLTGVYGLQKNSKGESVMDMTGKTSGSLQGMKLALNNELTISGQTKLKQSLNKQIDSEQETRQKNANARNTAMLELAEMPLMGFDGQSINANTADAATVIRGINSIADDTLRARAAKAFKTLTQTEGSRFYGENADGVGTFLESANLTRDEYRDAAEDYANRFYGDGKHDKEDAAAYLKARQEIEESEYSDYAKSQLTAALDKAYTGITGGKTPSASADDAPAEATDEERTTEEEQKKEKKPGFWSGLTGKVPEQDEQTEEKAENPAKAKAESQIVSQTMTASTTPGFPTTAKEKDEDSGKAPEVQGPVQMTPEERIIAQGGMSFAEWMAATPSVSSADTSLEEGGRAQKEKETAQTVGEAADALLKGRYDQIEGAGKDELDRMLAESGNARRMIGTLTEADSQRIILGNDMADAVTYGNIAAQGQTVKTLYDVMKSDSFPDELRGDVMAQMVVWAAQAEAMEQTGTLGGDAELPLMERLLTTDEHAMDELASIYAARDELLADKADMRRAQEEASAQALSDARTAALKGTASEEQLALVRQNAQAGQDELNADMGYVGRLAAVDDYFRPGASKNAISPFDLSSVKLNLDAQGVIDTGDYQAQLREQMDALLEEDTQTALALGLTLDEYYAKTGGVDMNALCERAASRISQQGAAITDEEMAALDVPFGQGVGASYTVGAGIRAGGEQWYLDFKDSLYTGYSQGMVLVNAARIQNRYQNEYGAYGRTQYRKDIESALASGTLDENYANALRKALAGAADVYQLGIDPMDFEGDFLKNSAEVRRDIATMEGYMRTNATEDEFKWFGRVKGMTYNAVSAGVAAGTTLATGSSLLGFNTGYSVVGFKNNFDEYLQKGYSIDFARYLSAVNTGLDCASNFGTFEGVLGRMTGMSALTEAARSRIIRNPAGACRGLAAIRTFGEAFSKAFAQNEFDEVVHDEFFEGLSANWTDNALGEIFRKVDAGEDITFTDGLNMALNLLNPKNLDVKGAAEGVVSGAVENAIGAVLFSLSGAAGSGVGTLRGVKAAQDLMSGKRTDVENVILDVTKTLGDEQACALLNDYARQQKESKAVAEEIISGKDERGSAAHAAKAKQQADEARAQAEAAQTAADNSRAQFTEASDAVMNGDLTRQKEMTEARVRMGENQKTANEQGAVAARRTDEMQQAAAQRLAEARQAGRKAVIAEDAAAREAMLDDREARMQAIDNEIAQLDAQQQAAEEEFYAATQSYTEAEAMGMDAETLGQLDARMNEIGARLMALYDRREALQNPEAYEARRKAETEIAEREQQAQEEYQRQTEREQTQSEMDEIAPVVRDIRKKRIWLNEQQIAEVLHTTGLRTIAQVNRQYGTQFRVNRKSADVDLDSGFFRELAAQIPGQMDEASAHPETEILNLLDRSGELKGKLGGMEASIGEGGAEDYLNADVSRGNLDPVTQKLASSLKQKTGLELIVMPLADKVRGFYDRENGRLILSSRIGAGEQMRQVVMHELTHYIESTKNYAAYEKAALEAAYRGDTEAMDRDAAEIRKTYEDAGLPCDVNKELAAAATEKLMASLGAWGRTGSETLVYDLLGAKQSFPIRVYNKLTQFLARRKAQKAGGAAVENYKALVRAREALRQAILEAGTWKKGMGGEDATIELFGKTAPVEREVTRGQQTEMEYAIAPRQFGNQKAQELDVLTDSVKKFLRGDQYETVTNREQVQRANDDINARGIDAVVNDLLARDRWTADDHAAAAVACIRAQNEGLMTTAYVIAKAYDEQGTNAGQALQARQIIGKLTAEGALVEAAKKADHANAKKGLVDGDIPVGSQAPVKGWRDRQQRSKEGAEREQNVSQTGEFDPDNPFNKGRTSVLPQEAVTGASGAAGDAVQGSFIERPLPPVLEKVYTAAELIQRQIDKLPSDVSYDNPWNIPLESWKTELIDQYGLNGTKLVGDTYSYATVKERMLAAILATDNNVRGDGILTLCQQLEAMKQGLAVVTEADLNYIAGQMSTFLYAEGADLEGMPVTTEGKTALQRVYNAQANVAQDSMMGKVNALGYTNMLSGTKTWIKNVSSNILIRPLELASEKIGGAIEGAFITKRTGNRTTDAPNRAERAAGREAFTGEIGQTMVDYFVTHADTGHGSGFDLNHNNRTFNNEWLQAYKNIVDFAMQVGDRPFWEQCYTEELAVIKRLGTKIPDTQRVDGREVKVLRDMTLEEMKTEAAVRATERVFQEDNNIVSAINGARRESPMIDLMITSMMPFLKTPTNVASRMMQYSPIGLARAIIQYGLWDGKRNGGANFDQRKFVMNLGRGLTGTGVAIVGALLASLGAIQPGREDEEDKKLGVIRKAQGRSYSTYFKLGDWEIPLDFAQPSSGPLYIGAKIAWAIEEMGDDVNVLSLIGTLLYGSALETGNQLFDNSFLSGFSALFSGYNDAAGIASNIAENIAENQASRLTPSAIRALAKVTDPYVRDVYSQNAVKQFLNRQIIQNWPLLRQTLPVKTDITGDATLQNGYYNWGQENQNAALHFLNAFATPWTTLGEKNDAALDTLIDLSYRTGETSFLPGEMVSASKYEVSITKTLAKELKVGRVGFNQYEGFKIRLTDEEKRWANSTYADTLFNGSGRDVIGLRAMMSGNRWERMSDEERIEAVRDMQKTAKKQVLTELVRRKKEAGEIR